MFSSYTWYTYPHVFQGQYATGVVPFLFLGLIDYLGLSVKREKDRNKTISKKGGILRRKSVNRPIVAILTILLFLNIFFTPFSPLNNQLGDQFNFQQNTSYNPQQYSELGSMLKMIPSSDQYIVYQNNIPELFPRPIPHDGALLMGGYLGSFTNVSVSEAINNSWQVSAGGKRVSMPVDYALADASNSNFYLDNNSVYSIVQDMYESGKYSILSEGYGLILLQRGYNGTVKNYVPENMTIRGETFNNSSLISHPQSGMAQSNVTGFIGEYVGTPLYLFPGIFTATLYLNSQYFINVSNIRSVILNVYSGEHTLLSTTENISTASDNLSIYKVTFSFLLNSISGNVWYSLYGPDKNFNVSVSKLVVTQTSPFQNKCMT